MKLTINGKEQEYTGEGDRPLLWYLREDLNLTGTKFGCGVAACGACTVLVDGEPTRACMTPAASLAGTTLEQIEKRAIRETLRLTGGNREQAAKLLGIGERTLYRKLKEYGVR